jgi:ribosomal protein S27E
MAGVYRPRHPERTVLYRVLFHYFDRFLAEYEGQFEKEYGFLRPIIKDVTVGHHEARRAVVISWCRVWGKRLLRHCVPRNDVFDCGNPRCGFARIRCPDCGDEHLLMFSCRTRGQVQSCKILP